MGQRQRNVSIQNSAFLVCKQSISVDLSSVSAIYIEYME